MQRLMLAALMLAIAAPAFAQPEDAGHRADRLRTIELNHRAQAAIDRRDKGNARIRDRGDDAQARYRRELAEWRERVAACRSGDYRACDDGQ